MRSLRIRSGAPVVDGVDWHKVNANHRREALRFTESLPLGDMVIMRLIMEPQRKLLARNFKVGSDQWESEQHALLVAAMDSGQDRYGARSYPMTEAAGGAAEA